MGPIIIVAKLIIQELWKLKLDWDMEIPEPLQNTWTSFYRELAEISYIEIPRNVLFSQYVSIEIHGFAMLP